MNLANYKVPYTEKNYNNTL